MDLFVVVTMFMAQFGGVLPIPLMITSITYLGFKGIFFFGEPMSIIDLLIALWILLMIFGVKSIIIFYLILVWFMYKLYFSFS